MTSIEWTDTLSRLRALLAEASLLPWGAVKGAKEALKGWPIGFECGSDDDGNWAVSIFGRHASEGPTRGAGNDARLIAAAVNALPALLAVAEAAERIRAADHARGHPAPVGLPVIATCGQCAHMGADDEGAWSNENPPTCAHPKARTVFVARLDPPPPECPLRKAPATPAPVVPSAVREDTFAALAKGLAEAVHRTIDGDRGAWKTVFEFTRAIEQVTEGYALDPRAALEEVLRG